MPLSICRSKSKFEIPAQIRFLKILIPAPPVVRRQLERTLFGHFSGQQAGASANRPVILCHSPARKAQSPVRSTHQKRVRRLQRGNRRNARGALHLFHAEVRHANPADLPRLLQPRHFGPALFDIGVRLRPVDLVQVDHVQLQPAQAVFTFFANGIRLQRWKIFRSSPQLRSHLVKTNGFLASPWIACPTTSSECPNP